MKKFLGVFTTIFLLSVCVMLSACSGKYDDMEFKVYYAFASDAETWYDGTNGITINYGKSGDELVFDAETSTATVYMKVVVNNVEEKYLDAITISTGYNGKITLSSTMVDSGEVFSITLTGSGQTNFKFTETNSGKAATTSFGVYESLTAMSANTESMPSMVLGGYVNLGALSNINYTPSETNQTKVLYEIDSAGYFNENNEYVMAATSVAADEAFIDSTTNYLYTYSSKYSLSSQNAVLRVKATSYYDSNISTYFYVYLVENLEYSPTLLYTNTTNKVSDFTLYVGSTAYASTSITVDLTGFASIYSAANATTIYTANGTASYVLKLYIDGVAFNLSTASEYRDLLIEKLDNFKIKITVTNTTYSANTVKFALEIDKFDFSHSDKVSTYSSSVKVSKSYLATNISVNDVTYADQGTGTENLYSTTSTSYSGLQLSLGVSPLDTSANNTVYLDLSTNLTLNSNSSFTQHSTSRYSVTSGASVYLTFVSGNTADSGTVVITTAASPSSFEGKTLSVSYITVTITINQVVTADSFNIYSTYSDYTLSDSVVGSSMLFAANGVSSSNVFYVKAYYSNGSIASSSLMAVSSNTDICFANGNSTIYFDNTTGIDTVATSLTDAGGTYAIYRVYLSASNSAGSTNITVYSGLGTVGVSSSFTANVVNITTDNSFSVSASGSSSSNDVTEVSIDGSTDFAYAVVYNKTIDFSLTGKLYGETSSKADAISYIALSPVSYTGSSDYSSYFSTSAVRYTITSSYEFSLTGIISNKTEIMALTIYYYGYNGTAIDLKSKTIYLQIAVYNAVSSISLTTSPSEITYINAEYTDAATSTISYDSYASSTSSSKPTGSVNFVQQYGVDSSLVSKDNVSSITFSMAQSLSDINDGYTAVKIYYGDTDITSYIERGSYEIAVDGSITVVLCSANIGYSSLTFNFVANRFGSSSSVTYSVSIIISDYESASSIVVSGDDVVKNGEDSYYIYMSFIDIEKDTDSDSVTFTAYASYTTSTFSSLRFDSLSYLLYKVEQDSNGDIVTTDGVANTTDITSYNRLTIDIDEDENLVSISAIKSGGGGLFKLVLVALDSYNDSTGDYSTTFTIYIQISDGTIANPYIITTAEEMDYVINNMSANYVLGANITLDSTFSPIGYKDGAITAFTGTFSGNYQTLYGDSVISTATYSITMTLASGVKENTDVYSGLFARLGSGAVVSDLNIYVTFDTSNILSNTSGSALYVGAVAGYNAGGTIQNVNVEVQSKSVLKFYSSTSTPIYFGAMVGYNAGKINLKDTLVSTNGSISIYTELNVNHYIGIVAGGNSGEIYGSYSGKEDLEEVNYEVLGNINLYNTNAYATLIYSSVGGIVGTNDSGYIHNILVGGSIKVVNTTYIYGYIGGVAGTSTTETSSSDKGIDTVCVLAMDLDAAGSSSSVGGIVGSSTNSTGNTNISNVRFVSALNDEGEAAGTISGSNYVAGLVANSADDVIKYATLENFITYTDGSVFYTIISNSTSGTVGGFIANNSGSSITNSFVNVNVSLSGTEQFYTTSSGTENNTYFLGQVKNYASSTISKNSSTTNYAIIYSNSEIFDVSKNSTLTLSTYVTITKYSNDGAADATAFASALNLSDYFETASITDESSFNSEKTSNTTIYYKDGSEYKEIAAYSDTITDYYYFDSTAWASVVGSLYTADGDKNLTKVDTSLAMPDQSTTYYVVRASFADSFSSLYYLDSVYYLNGSDAVINLDSTYYHITSLSADWQTYIMGLTGLNLTAATSYDDSYTSYYSLTDGIYSKIDSITDADSFSAALTQYDAIYALSGNWTFSEEGNAVYIGSLVFYFPYLLDGSGEVLMIEQPTSIDAKIDQEYVEDDDSVYVKDFDLGSYDVTDTAIINYRNYEVNPLLNTQYNTYEIANLVEFTILPSSSTGGIAYEIVVGSDYAYISGSQIIFVGVSGSSPIVVKCYSVFNTDIYEFIVFYTQLGISDLVLKSSSANFAETYDASSAEYELIMYTGAGSTLITFDALNSDGVLSFSTILDEEDLSDSSKSAKEYLSIELSYDSTLLNITSTSNLTGVSLAIASTDFSGNTTSTTVTFYMYINLTEYFGKDSSGVYIYQENDGSDIYLCLASTTLEVTLIKSANSLNIDGSDAYEIYTNGNTELSVSLSTGYVTTTTASYDIDYTTDAKTNTLTLNESNKDSITLTITGSDNDTALDTLLSNAGVDSPIDLFEFSFDCVLATSGGSNTGYTYTVSIQLKDDFDYRYITSNITLTLTFAAVSDSSIYDSVTLTLMPVEVSTAVISNYTATSVAASTNYINLISSNATETAIITPGGFGGIMVIYIEPAYSNVLSATLTSSSIYVSSLGRYVSITFEQVVYNATRGCYENIYPTSQSIDGGIQLQLVTNSDGSYSGVIYVHTMLDSFSGLEATIYATLTVETASTTITKTKTLITQYIPGTSVSFNGIEVSGGYLIQQDSYDNILSVQVYGYQFNSNPTVEITWADGSDTWTDEDGNTYLVGNYVVLQRLTDASSITANDDGSYTMKYNINVFKGIPRSFTISVSLSLTGTDDIITSESTSVTFYPTDYLLDSVTISNLASGILNMSINTSTSLGLSFVTKNTSSDSSDAIYDILINSLTDSETGEYFTNLANCFYYYTAETGTTYFSSSHSEFSISLVNGKITILGNSEFSHSITFSVYYGYKLDEDTGTYSLYFSSTPAGSSSLSTSFTLIINSNTTEDNAVPIYSASDIYDTDGNCLLGSGVDYILMNDITLENFTPISTTIASFDGNNKVITIKSFAVDVSATNYGLFASIGTYTDTSGNTQQTILKNIIVDYGQFEGLYLTNNSITDITFGGLVGTNNGGLIYNCDVMNISSKNSSVATIEILVDDDQDVSVVFGGLVGNNSGIITNSRVGKTSYTQIIVTDTYQTTTTVYGAGLEFVIWSGEGSTSHKFIATAGGLVGINSGTIASSYFTNASLVDYSTRAGSSQTAGFVGTNSGNISYSYAEADTTSYKISAASNGNVAGFVYSNSGTITNCYSNVQILTYAAFASGFVYTNLEAGSISECYSACEFVDGSTTASTEQPFVGVDSKGTILTDGTIENCYYLYTDEYFASFEDNTQNEGKDSATALNADNFANSDNLNGFVFVLSSSKAERDQGIWSYYTVDTNEYKTLPQLVSANTIAYSYRYLVEYDKETNTYTYTNAADYQQGSINNPYIIRSVEEYNKVLTSDGASSSMAGYVRFINNINFADDETAIKTRVGYTLGDADGNTTTSLDGNGMTISGIYLDVGQSTEESIGLFSEITNAYIKNLNLQFTSTSDSQFSSTSVVYSGGLAGKISNSVVINISLDGENTTIAGKNFAGGLAGLVSGNSLIYGVETNLSVYATNTNSNYNLYVNETDFYAMRSSYISASYSYSSYIASLSYAGGLAGVIDITARSTESFNLSYIYIHGDQMMNKTTTLASGGTTNSGNITADYAGGVAGYASSGTSSFRLKYYTGTTDLISGTYAAGGLFGVNMGSILASQVTADEDTQTKYDTALGAYVIALASDSTSGTDAASIDTTDTSSYGNLNLIESYAYAGGLVGIGIGGSISSSYSKASFKSGVTIGGMIGLSFASSMTYSYAVTFVNLDSSTRFVGGLVGAAYGIRDVDPSRNSSFKLYQYLTKANASDTSQDTDLQFTFSTLLLNDDVLETLTLDDDTATLVVDYLCADYKDASEQYISSNFNSSLQGVYVGEIDYTMDGSYQVKNSLSISLSVVAMEELYNLDDPDQSTIFSNIFASWDQTYWTFDNTRFFPLLLNEEASNYIEIDSADDFLMLIANPDGKYKITKDIDMSGYTASGSNYIFDIEFTGVLVGELENDSIPTIYGLSINATESGKGAGLFKATTGATINNINIAWYDSGAGAITSSVQTLGEVTGLSGQDSDSTFTNITVCVNSQQGNIMKDGGDGYLFNNSDTTNPKTIAGFAGLVGSATNTSILNCYFTGSVNAIIYSDTDSYVAGLVGSAASSADLSGADETASTWQMTMSNCNFGLNQQAISITVDILSSFSGTLYVGGAVAYSDTISISNIVVGTTLSSASGSTNSATITVGADGSTYACQQIIYGGLVGYSGYTQISSCNVYADFNLRGTNSYANTTSNAEKIGGLVGEYSIQASGVVSIKKTNIYTNIYIYGDHPVICLSAGIAYSNSALRIDVTQCLFTGSINTELTTDDDVKTSIGTLYSGGVLGYAHNSDANGSSTLYITESMCTVDQTVGTATTSKLVAGGLVGYGYLLGYTASNAQEEKTTYSSTAVVTTGKLVAVTKSDIETDDAIYLGGIAGYIEKVYLSQSYSLTSILTDSITGESASHVNAGALFGCVAEETSGSANLDSEMSDVYYSSDLALAVEESSVATGSASNFSAYILLEAGTNWASSALVDSGLFTSTSYSADLVPYITSLESALVSFGVVIQRSDNTYSYTEGSVLNPVIITDSTSCVFKSDFTYYLISPTASFVNSDGASKDYILEGELNGILIGGDVSNTATAGIGVYNGYEITQSNFSTATYDGYASVTALVTKVGSHSAVSNIHIYISSSYSSLNFFSGINSLLVGINEGVVFNCSVQGDSLEVSANAGQYLAVIAGSNTGLVAYSYSSIEIKSMSGLNAVGGIVYQSEGVIYSCYFTGYIYNEGTNDAAAGIAVLNSGYIGNSYMGGVINTVSTSGNSFVVSNSGTGRNNYMDAYANIEQNLSDTTLGLKSVGSSYIMSGSNDKDGWSLAGEWVSSVVYSTETGYTDYYTVDTTNSMFGYNYLYPVYAFNKLISISETEFAVYENMYQAYTGSGTSDDDYFLVPHLGVFSAVQSLAASATNATGFYCLFIYDIDGKEVSWTAIGSSNGVNGFYGAASISGTYSSNRYRGAYSTFLDAIANGGDVSYVTITNMNNNGLMHNIKNADISYFVFGNFASLENSGPIGNASGGEININYISYVSTGVTISGSSNYLGGLFGTIDGSTINIKNWTTGSDTDSAGASTNAGYYITFSSANYVGLLAGQISGSSTIYFINTNSDTKNNPLATQYVCFASSITYAGGLVGEMSNGSISTASYVSNVLTASDSSTENDLELRVFTTSDFTGGDGKLGGIIGNATGGTVSNISVTLSETLGLYANSFGGLANNIAGSVTFVNCDVLSESGSSITVSAASSGFTFGLIAATASTGTVEVREFNTAVDEIKIEIVTTTGVSSSSAEAGIGVLLGIQSGGSIILTDSVSGTTGSTTTKINADITVGAVLQNVGGVVGKYKNGGKIWIAISDYTVKISASHNVGGAFGYFEGSIESITEKDSNFETDGRYASVGSILDIVGGNTSFATITIEEVTTDSGNIGGLIGYCASSLEDASIKVSNKINVESADESGTVYNIGGVVGYLASGNIKNASYSGSITTNGQKSEVFDVDYSVYSYDFGASSSYTIRSVNVGGIVGYIAGEATLTDCTVGGSISGYQNVGGIVGYAPDDKNITITYTSVFSSDTSSDGHYRYDSEGYVYDYSSTTSGGYSISGTSANAGSTIFGILNVGGVVGYLGKGNTIDKVLSTASVYGNASVGGLVGYAYGATVTNAIVATIQTEGATATTTTVNAVYYGMVYQENKTSATGTTSKIDKVYVVIPTSIGGLVGSSESSTITYCTVDDVDVISVEEASVGEDSDTNGAESSYADEYTSSTINTVYNYMMKLAFSGSSSSYNASYYGSYASVVEAVGSKTSVTSDNLSKSAYKLYYDSITSGFGGLVGSIDGNGFGSDANTNTVNKVTITAYLGVNVGTIYGYIYFDETEGDIAVPNISGSCYVDGSYNVGGVVGNLDIGGNSTLTFYFTNNADGIENAVDLSSTSVTTAYTVELTGNGTVYVQTQSVLGMYVGGLFGKLASAKVTLLSIYGGTTSGKVNFSIGTSDSYYTGGLIGILDGGNSDITFNGIVYGTILASGADDTENFGGLIGFLKVGYTGSTSYGYNVNINGYHEYAFTINTVENSNYYDGKTSYDYNTSSDGIFLIAQAYYVNLDNFSIVASANTELYDGSNDYNPLNNTAKGWAKDYTMFKTLQRNIPQGENNGAEWDAISTIYDASNITAVGTIASLGLTTSNEHDLDDDYIVYTVYEETDGSPTLYSRIGIATPYKDDDGNYVRPEDQTQGFLSTLLAILGSGDVDTNYYYIYANKNSSLQDLYYFNWTKSYQTTTNLTVSIQSSDTDVRYVTYRVDNYDTDSTFDNNAVYFVFDVIYENASTNTATSDSDYVTNASDSYLPDSGSIFLVGGIISSNGDEWLVSGSSTRAKLVKAASILVKVVFICLTMGTGSIMTIAKTAGKLVLQAIKKIAVTLIKYAVKHILSVIIIGMLTYLIVGSSAAKTTYTNRTDTSFGFLSGSYTREISYTKNVLNTNNDAYIVDANGNMYFVYSSTRPSDYYENYYYAVNVGSSDGSGLMFTKSILNYDSSSNTDSNGYYVTESSGVYYLHKTSWTESTELMRYYYYHNGYYYYLAEASEVTYTPTQAFSTVSEEDLGTNLYTSSGGYYYVYGSYNSSNKTYSVDSDRTNLKDDGDGTYSINGTAWENSTFYTTYGISATLKETVYFSYVTTTPSGVEGYDYLKGAYYTANGTYKGDGLPVRYGTFKYTGKSKPSGTNGIDYLTYYITEVSIDGEGNETSSTVPVYYDLISVSTSGSGEDYSSTIISEPSSGQPITIKLYPYSFTNPYKSGSTVSGTQDSYYYTVSDTEKVGVSAEVTYFYYDGGYIPGSEINASLYTNGEVFKLVKDPDTGSGYKWGSYTISSSSSSVTLYSPYSLTLTNTSGGTISTSTISAADFSSTWYSYSMSYSDLVKNYSTLTSKSKPFYISYPSAEFDEYDATTKSSFETYYAVWYNYYLDTDDSLYELTSSYSVKNGGLSSASLTPISADTDDYNFNKYLSNAYYFIYTRYKYTSFALSGTNSGWGWYYLYKTQTDGSSELKSNPNSGTTYLVESVCVTLGGRYLSSSGTNAAYTCETVGSVSSGTLFAKK